MRAGCVSPDAFLGVSPKAAGRVGVPGCWARTCVLPGPLPGGNGSQQPGGAVELSVFGLSQSLASESLGPCRQ